MHLAAIDLALGLPGALAAGRLLRGQIYGVSAADPVTLAATVALLVAVALGASVITARRATRVDPAAALRQE